MTAAILKNYEQALYKINQNSVIGAMGTEFSAMYDLESFNAVTSLARHGIIMAYAFAERFLANNHYFPDIERLLNYIIVLANAAPSKEIIDNLVAKYNLFIPTCMDISESLLESMQNYDLVVHKDGSLQKQLKILHRTNKFIFFMLKIYIISLLVIPHFLNGGLLIS